MSLIRSYLTPIGKLAYDLEGKTDPSLDAQYCTLRSEAAGPISVDVDAAKHAPILCVGVTVYSIAMRRLKSYTRHSDRHSRTRVA